MNSPCKKCVVIAICNDLCYKASYYLYKTERLERNMKKVFLRSCDIKEKEDAECSFNVSDFKGEKGKTLEIIVRDGRVQSLNRFRSWG